jgi:hypothetical protein
MNIGQQLMSRLVSGLHGASQRQADQHRQQKRAAKAQFAENVRRERARAESKFIA